MLVYSPAAVPNAQSRIWSIAADAAEAALGDTGRLLIRKSGTEPLIRVMAEGSDETLIQEIVAEIVDAMEKCA